MNYSQLLKSLVETYYTAIVRNPEKLDQLKLEKRGIWKDDGTSETKEK